VKPQPIRSHPSTAPRSSWRVAVWPVALTTLALPFAACHDRHSAPPPATAPAAPEILAVTVGDGSVDIAWSVVSNATSYNLYWECGTHLDLATCDRVREHQGSSYHVGGLQNGDTYCFAVSANGGDLESALSPLYVRALPPGVVPSIVATAGDRQVTIEWSAVAGATSYALHRATSPGVTAGYGQRFAPVESPHVDAALVNGTTYYYVVTAIGAGGEGRESAEVAATPQASPPPPPPLLAFAPSIVLSQEPTSGGWPGQAAAKVQLVQLTDTPGGALDGRLIVTYADAGSADQVWDPTRGQHAPSDIFVRCSDDLGISWSPPVNVSRTAGLYSAISDWDGDGVDKIFRGDSSAPTIFAAGPNVVVLWTDRYVPAATWTWGQCGQNPTQGRIAYKDPTTYPNPRVVPFAAQYCAISTDGGTTWRYGITEPPLQLTCGRRDVAANGVVRASGARWAIVWQEDAVGLQVGEGAEPGEGPSATTTTGTDVWYTWTSDLVGHAMALRTNRVPLTDHSAYDRTGSNGFPTVGDPGAVESHAASRPDLQLVDAGGGGVVAVVAYEETKGTPTVHGKTARLHVFPFDAPILGGEPDSVHGAAGTSLSELPEHSRQVRLLAQPPNGVDPAIVVFWRQGVGDHGAPADLVLRAATTLDAAAVATAPLRNLSSRTPTGGNLADPTPLDPDENAHAHCGLLRGPLLVIGYGYTPGGPLLPITGSEHGDFWIRRSLDGGATWHAPQDVTQVTDPTIDVTEPRLVAPPATAGANPNVFVVAWGTATTHPEGNGTIEPLDLFAARTLDQGATFQPTAAIAATAAPEFEPQLAVKPDGSRVYAVWTRSGTSAECEYALGGNPLRAAAPTEPTTIGNVVELELLAPGHEGAPYVAGAALGITPGLMTPFGRIALNDDALLAASAGAQGPGVTGFVGTVPQDGTAAATVLVPQQSALIGLTFYVGFVTVPVSGPWGLAAPGRVDVR
jgi:hypothetical protein